MLCIVLLLPYCVAEIVTLSLFFSGLDLPSSIAFVPLTMSQATGKRPIDDDAWRLEMDELCLRVDEIEWQLHLLYGLPIRATCPFVYFHNRADVSDREFEMSDPHNSCFNESVREAPMVNYETLTPIYDVYDDDVEYDVAYDATPEDRCLVDELVENVHIVELQLSSSPIEEHNDVMSTSFAHAVPRCSPSAFPVLHESRTTRSQERENDTIREMPISGSLSKTAISTNVFGVRRPMSTTFEDLFKGYNFVVYTKIGIQEEEGRNFPTTRQQRFIRGFKVMKIKNNP